MRSYAILFFAIGCAGSRQVGEAKKAEATPIASAPASDAALVATESDPALLAGTPRRKRARFAPSPITELGEKILELVVAMIDGRPVPNDLPLGTPRAGTGPVQLTGLDLDEARGIDWFAVGLEIDFSVTMQGDKHPNVESVYMLSEAGLHLIGVEVGDRERKHVLPEWARGLETVATDLLRTARKGNLATLLPGDDVRRLIADDDLWEKATRSLPKADALAKLEAFARAATSGPTGFRMDDVELVGHGRNGRIHNAKLDFDEADGRVVLEPHVHVRVVTRPNETTP